VPLIRDTARLHLAAAAGDHVVDSGGGQRRPVVNSQLQQRPLRPSMPRTDPAVPVEAVGIAIADLDARLLVADTPWPWPDVSRFAKRRAAAPGASQDLLGVLLHAHEVRPRSFASMSAFSAPSRYANSRPGSSGVDQETLDLASSSSRAAPKARVWRRRPAKGGDRREWRAGERAWPLRVIYSAARARL